MTPQYIKANAPEGATHYYVDAHGQIFYFKGEMVWMDSWWFVTLGIGVKLKPL